MKSKLLAVMCIISVLVMIPGCSLLKKANPDSTTIAPVEFKIPANYTTYTDESSLFKISFPQDWTVDNSVLDDPDVLAVLEDIQAGSSDYTGSSVFFAGLASTEGYRPNFNISVSPVPTGYTYDLLLAAELAGLKQQLTGYKQNSVAGTTIDGHRASIVDVEGSFDAVAGTNIGIVHDIFMFTIVDGNEWVIVCSSFDDSFSQWSADFNNIVRSLKVTG